MAWQLEMKFCPGTLPVSRVEESLSGCSECLVYDVFWVMESGKGPEDVVYFSSKMFDAA